MLSWSMSGGGKGQFDKALLILKVQLSHFEKKDYLNIYWYCLEATYIAAAEVSLTKENLGRRRNKCKTAIGVLFGLAQTKLCNYEQIF